jgi:hypothetical membrane protein
MQQIRTVGYEAALLFLASLASFIVGIFSPRWFSTAMIFCALFFLAAAVILAIKIKSRRKTIVG